MPKRVEIGNQLPLPEGSPLEPKWAVISVLDKNGQRKRIKVFVPETIEEGRKHPFLAIDLANGRKFEFDRKTDLRDAYLALGEKPPADLVRGLEVQDRIKRLKTPSSK